MIGSMNRPGNNRSSNGNAHGPPHLFEYKAGVFTVANPLGLAGMTGDHEDGLKEKGYCFCGLFGDDDGVG
jgi:hypothetical protein